MGKNIILQKLKEFGLVLFRAANDFLDDKCLKKSASLAYYSVFSIGPLLLILIWALGFFYGNQLSSPTGARDEIITELVQLFGADITNMLDAAMMKISFENEQSLALYIGVGILIFSSTTIFIDIQNSINEIWKIKIKPKKGWLKLVIDRLISFSMIIGLGFLLMLSLVLSSVIGILTTFFGQHFLEIDMRLIELINSGITFVVTTTLFGLIFAFLPDAKVRFRDILAGALFTALLFLLGKYLIAYYLSNNAIASSYGAAGSVIIMLAFVYYSAAILYYGAEFTKQYAIQFGKGIKPASYAVIIKQVEVEVANGDSPDAITKAKKSDNPDL